MKFKCKLEECPSGMIPVFLTLNLDHTIKLFEYQELNF